MDVLHTCATELMAAFGHYKKARDSSLQVLADNRIITLPVSVLNVVENNGIKLIKDECVHELRPGESGISIYDYGDSAWYIVYDDTIDIFRKRFTVAHELGHIFMRHPLTDCFYARVVHNANSPPEIEADVFARCLLSPACVLWGLNVRTAADISDICRMPYDMAEIRAERLPEVIRCRNFLTSPLERQVYRQFSGYIGSYRPNSG